MRSLVIVCFLGAVIAATVRPPFVRGEAFGTDEALFAALRDRMVTEQIRARDVADPRVLAALRKVPRHRFVPEQFRAEAYDDHPLPIGEGQTISQPYIVGIMSELLQCVKTPEGLLRKSIIPVRFVPLTGEAAKKKR